MKRMSRRGLVAGVAGMSVLPAAVRAAAATPPAGATTPPAAARAAPGPVTRTLARYLVGARSDELPERVRQEGLRTLLNYMAVAIGGSRHETVDIAVSALAPFSGPRQASLLGRSERFDVMNAAFINGVSSHVFDFDDTHLKTIIHPGSVVISAALALAELRPVSGKEFLNALVLGIETACRIGNAVYPDHYDVGWHITGTAGVFGAAAAAGRLLGLSEQQMVWALGLAASQPVGLRESFGSMNKSFNPGSAASNGLFAAILASKGYTSSEGMIEARRGWAHTISTKQSFEEITSDLGKRYEAALNTYKPFACGIVLHPAIDAAIQLRNENRLTAADIRRIELKVNPLVLELTGKQTPQLGLEGKFSVYHAVAIALIEGVAGEHQFSDRAVRDPVVQALRAKVVPVVDPGMTTERVDLAIELTDGRVLRKHIEHAIGSLENPMTNADLEKKFADLAVGVMPAAQARKVMDLCWQAESLRDAGALARAAVSRRA